MRQIVLDTETTGLNPTKGDRIVEIGCIEMVDSHLTGAIFQRYLNPEIPMPVAVQAVHGLKDSFLADKPKFSEIVDSLINFLAGAELIVHNAPFDLAFLNAELALCNREPIESACAGVIDTLQLARNHRPGQRNGLDAVCIAFDIDSSARVLHGALTDAMLLVKVYLAMKREWALADTIGVSQRAYLPID